jgi:hypothetical protein
MRNLLEDLFAAGCMIGIFAALTLMLVALSP